MPCFAWALLTLFFAFALFPDSFSVALEQGICWYLNTNIYSKILLYRWYSCSRPRISRQFLKLTNPWGTLQRSGLRLSFITVEREAQRGAWGPRASVRAKNRTQRDGPPGPWLRLGQKNHLPGTPNALISSFSSDLLFGSSVCHFGLPMSSGPFTFLSFIFICAILPTNLLLHHTFAKVLIVLTASGPCFIAKGRVHVCLKHTVTLPLTSTHWGPLQDPVKRNLIFTVLKSLHYLSQDDLTDFMSI